MIDSLRVLLEETAQISDKATERGNVMPNWEASGMVGASPKGIYARVSNHDLRMDRTVSARRPGDCRLRANEEGVGLSFGKARLGRPGGKIGRSIPRWCFDLDVSHFLSSETIDSKFC
jgi:hypothetical protein